MFNLIRSRPSTFLAICRLSPFLPYSPTNYIFGLTDMPITHFLAVSIPTSVPLVFTGANAGMALGGVSGIGGDVNLGWSFWALTAVGATLVRMMVIICYKAGYCPPTSPSCSLACLRVFEFITWWYHAIMLDHGPECLLHKTSQAIASGGGPNGGQLDSAETSERAQADAERSCDVAARWEPRDASTSSRRTLAAGNVLSINLCIS